MARTTPDPVLDSGRYDFETSQGDNSVSVLMTSPPDERSGLRIRRGISLGQGSSRLHLNLSFENISDRTIRWSIWDVAQMACRSIDGQLNDDCWLYIPTDPNRERPYEIMFGDDNDQYQLDSSSALLAVQYQGIVGKIGVHSPAGWIAFADRRNGFVLCMQFPYHARCRISRQWRDGGMLDRIAGRAVADTYTLARIYSRGGSPQSAATRCTPMEIAMQHRVTWSAAYCPAPIVAVSGCRMRAPAAIDRPQ